MDDRLLEPLEAYKQFYEKEFRENASKFFDALVKKSGVSVGQNAKTVSEYDGKMRKVELLSQKISRYKALKGFMIFLIVFGAILTIAGILCLCNQAWIAGSLLLAFGVASVATAIPVMVAKISPILKDAEAERSKRQGEANKLLEEAWKQMEPLNALFDDNMTKELIEQTVPLLKIDDNFNMRRYDYLCGKYGFGGPDDPQRSTIGIMTGEILGNPFVIDRELVHSMGTCTYTGSLVITWTTTYVDSEGNTHFQHHSQTLVATISRPKPYYSVQTRLIYGNEAAPDLHFSRTPQHSERLNEREREKKVNKGAKKIRKKQEESIRKGNDSFTGMGNEEFDVLFGALDRDNEVQFRLLFTPLAQKNMVSLMTDAAGYGDDFSMKKRGCLNYISSEHSAAWDMDTGYRRYLSYGVELAKKAFVDFNCNYFKSLYFDFAPLLSIPLYQQQKPREYLYRESYPSNFNGYESEYAANKVGEEAFEPKGAATRSILKTTFLGGEGKTDRVLVTAYSYTAVERVELVPTFGGDGNMHAVPVPWTEYIPAKNERTVRMRELGLTERAYERSLMNGPLKEIFSRVGVGAHGYGHGIVCYLSEDESSPIDGEFSDIKTNS